MLCSSIEEDNDDVDAPIGGPGPGPVLIPRNLVTSSIEQSIRTYLSKPSRIEYCTDCIAKFKQNPKCEIFLQEEQYYDLEAMTCIDICDDNDKTFEYCQNLCPEHTDCVLYETDSALMETKFADENPFCFNIAQDFYNGIGGLCISKTESECKEQMIYVIKENYIIDCEDASLETITTQ